MPSPVNNPRPVNNPDETELPDDALIARPGQRPGGPPRRVWVALALLAILVPAVLTGLGALTAPPHVKRIPTGRLVYLEADAPSEKTTTLRGLFAVGADGTSRLLQHEAEPQDTDGGERIWITQPALSPDGTQVAFEKQLITLRDDKQSVVSQIWVMPLAPGAEEHPPHLVIDLTASKLKQIAGLAWDSDSSLLFLEDGDSYSVPTDTAEPPLRTPLPLHGLVLSLNPELSATRFPVLTEAGTFAYGVQTPAGLQVLTQVKAQTALGPAARLFALSPDGTQIAFVPPDRPKTIRVYDVAAGTVGPDIPTRWGWSVFGRRELTSLRWSPDGSQIAYTVSKPPVPEDELFAVTPATGQVVQLPYRTGRAGWDWGRDEK